MRIIEVRYQRVKNLGNYETERVEMVAIVGDNEDHQYVMQQLKKEVEIALELLKTQTCVTENLLKT